MKKIIMVTFLSTLFSCNNNHTNTSAHMKAPEKVIGSTIENIDNSEYKLIQFQIDGKLCFATINQFFEGYQSKSSFPFSLWVSVQTLNKNENGHPVDKEATLFNALEDSLIGKFASNTPFCFIGRTTRDGYRELMFYVSDQKNAAKIMNEFISKNEFNRKVEFDISPDVTWESVSGFYE